jgi:hypothetical protein
VIVALLLPSWAGAHSWYEPKCCSGVDCKPVDDEVIAEKSDGLHVQGFGIMSYTDPRLNWSRDYQNHLCVRGGKLLCIYRRPQGT